MLAEFIRGIYFFLMGFKLIRKPELFRFLWIPLLCNIVVFILLFILAAYGLNHFSHWVVHFLPQWLSWLHWLIWVLTLVVSAIALIYISLILINIIVGPFNALLSEKVVACLGMTQKPVQVSLLKSLPLAVIRQFKLMRFYLPRAVFYLLLFIIPLIQLIAAFLWFLFNGWMFTMQYLDYPMDNHGVSIDKMRAQMAKKPGVCLGFGCAVVTCSMIPLINFVVVPVAVVGATLLWVKEFAHQG